MSKQPLLPIFIYPCILLIIALALRAFKFSQKIQIQIFTYGD